MSGQQKDYWWSGRFLALAIVSVGVGLFVATQLVPPCGGRVGFTAGSHRCGNTFVLTNYLSLVGVVVGVALWFSKNVRLNAWLAAIVLSDAILVLWAPSPWGNGLCRREDMSCHQTVVWVYGLAFLLIAVAGIRHVLSVRELSVAQAPLADPWESPAPGKTHLASSKKGRNKCCG